MDLKLSIQDVSSQTRLAPLYIEAVEEGHFDVFQEDTAFIRYFIHAYCDAIGVNWNMISEQVDQSIRLYAMQKEYQQTQTQQLAQTQQTQPLERRSRSQRNGFQKQLGHFKDRLRWTKKQWIQAGIITIVVIFGLFTIVNFQLNRMAHKEAEIQAAKQKQELSEKEKQTELLAQQRKQEAEKEATEIMDISPGSNVYLISNVLEHGKQIQFEITLPVESNILIYKDNQLVTDENKVYKENFEKTFTLEDDCTFTLEIMNYAKNEIYVNGKAVVFNETYWYEGQSAILEFTISSNENKQATQAELEASLSQEDVYDSMYYEDEEVYE